MKYQSLNESLVDGHLVYLREFLERYTNETSELSTVEWAIDLLNEMAERLDNCVTNAEVKDV